MYLDLARLEGTTREELECHNVNYILGPSNPSLVDFQKDGEIPALRNAVVTFMKLNSVGLLNERGLLLPLTSVVQRVQPLPVSRQRGAVELRLNSWAVLHRLLVTFSGHRVAQI